MSTIRKILNGNNVDEDFPNLTPGEVTKFRYAKITSCDVERSFSKYKNILRSNRRYCFIIFLITFDSFALHLFLLIAENVLDSKMGELPLEYIFTEVTCINA
ncbi:Uncharacterized protein FWK35_00015373 [Aphis craccivora]|uniref:Uncharacterized protein n=1 Tax=Aphis craccivora TaxID=307492 RepID=A0A6G0YR63_APHCR|nr:Uncharacterized protein FWK35_00015373 [Aphis craccivora]